MSLADAKAYKWNCGMFTTIGALGSLCGSQRKRSSVSSICRTRALSGRVSSANVLAPRVPSGLSPWRRWKRRNACDRATGCGTLIAFERAQLMRRQGGQPRQARIASELAVACEMCLEKGEMLESGLEAVEERGDARGSGERAQRRGQVERDAVDGEVMTDRGGIDPPEVQVRDEPAGIQRHRPIELRPGA